MIKSALKRILGSITANGPSQLLLERLVAAEQWLMGVGSGGVAENSGERVVVKLLRDRSRRVGRALSVFDVGANQGQFLTMVLEGLPDIALRVHAFEPSTATFAMLQRRYGNDGRVKLNHAGLGRHCGTMTLYSDAEGSGMASLYQRRLDHFGLALDKSETVTVETADAYCRRENIDHLDLLKLDVEGHELDVLRGAEDLFRRESIEMVTFEFGGCNIDSRSYLQDFFYFFREHGRFDLYRITPTGYLAPVGRYSEIHEQFRTTNYLARRP